MRGSIPFDCALSIKRKSSQKKEYHFNFDLYRDHLVGNKKTKTKEKCLWFPGSMFKFSPVYTSHQTKTSLVTPGHCSATPPVAITKDPTTPQSLIAGKQTLTADTKDKQQTAVMPERLSADKNVLSPHVLMEKTVSSVSENTPKSHTAAADILPSSYSSVNPFTASGFEKTKEASKTPLKGQTFSVSDENYLLYDEYFDEEMSSELDSSMEGRLLIDESMSDNDEEIKEKKVPVNGVRSIPPTNKPTPDKRLNTSIPKYSDFASGVEPKLCSQKLTKDLDAPEISSLSNIENGKDCTAAKTNDKENVNKERILENTESQTGIQNLSTSANRLGTPLTNSKIVDPPAKKADRIKTDAQSSNPGYKNLSEFIRQNGSAVFKETVNNLCRTDMPPKMAPSLKNTKDNNTEKTSKTKNPPEILRNVDTASPVQPNASPDSTIYTGEELFTKVPCRKMSFILLNDQFICLSCSKRFTNESVFKKHAWHHFHHHVSVKQWCTHCYSNKNISQCPTVKKVSTILHNAYPKVASLPLDLSHATLPQDKKETIDPTVSPERLITNNPKAVPNRTPTPPEHKTLENTNSPLLGHSQNLNYVTVFISSQQFVCMKCYERIVPSQLAQHIYRHLHKSSSLHKHGTYSAREHYIMGKIVSVIPSPDLSKSGFFILDTSWKWSARGDLKFKILLIRHNPEIGAANNGALPSRKEDLQVVKSSVFCIPYQTKESSPPPENESNDMDVKVIGYKPGKDDNMILDHYSDVKEPSYLVKMKQTYKKMTFLIRCGHYMCSSCNKIYFDFNMLMAHIMWHFHSHKKLCSISHYDSHLSQCLKECPILSNITRCIPKLDQEIKMVNIYWRTNVQEKTSFMVRVINLKKDLMIDLTDEMSDNEDDTGRTQNSKERTPNDVDSNSLDTCSERDSESAPRLEYCGIQETRPSFETETLLMPVLEKVSEPKLQDDSLTAANNQAKDVPNSSKSEGGFYICGFSDCKFSCIESDQFQQHFKELHSDENQFPCIHCSHQSSSQDLLLKHMDTHTSSTLFLLYHCSMCEYASNIPNDFEHHLWSYHSENSSYFCHYCKQRFPTIKVLLDHLAKNLLKFILCPHCSARDIYRRRMLNHIRTKHPDKPRKIIVTSQIICKTIIQNKRKQNGQEDTEDTPNSKNNGDVLIILDDEDEENGSKTDDHIEDKENLSTIPNHIPQTDREIKANSASSNHPHLRNLVTNVKTKPILNRCDIRSDVEIKSKNSSKAVKDNKSDDVIIIEDDDDSGDKHSCRGVETRKDKTHSLILSELLVNNEGKRASAKIQKSRIVSGKKGVVDEKRKKVITEHYTVKDSSKFPCELKIMLRRTSPKEINDARKVCPPKASPLEEEKAVKNKNGDVQDLSEPKEPIPSSEIQNALSQNGSALNGTVGVIDNVDNDVEDNLNQNALIPSLLQDISLSGATLDLRLQKCYVKNILPNQSKSFVCSICHKFLKTLYQIHLHLLSDHFKWPLWECQLCGVRVYKHSKMTNHWWRDHQDLSPQIKSLSLPVIVLDENNKYVVANIQEPFLNERKNSPPPTTTPTPPPPPAPLANGKKKDSKSIPPKSKKYKSAARKNPTPAETPKHSRKRSRSCDSDKTASKKTKRNSPSENALRTADSNSANNSAMAGDSTVTAAIVRPTRPSSEQPPKKKAKTSNPKRDRNKCFMCGLNYSSKSNFYILQHVLTEHTKEYQNLISDEEIEEIEEAITGNSVLGYICPFCNHATKQRVDCKIHIWRMHAGLKLLDCSQCKFVTWFSRHMKRHMAEHHKDKQENPFENSKETPLFGNADSNSVSLTPDSQIQQEGDAENSSGQVKSKRVTFLEQEARDDHSKPPPRKKTVNGVTKNKTGGKKSLKAKSSSDSKKRKYNKKSKSLKSSDVCTKTSTKSKNTKTPSTSVRPEKVSTTVPLDKTPNTVPLKKMSATVPLEKTLSTDPLDNVSTTVPLKKMPTRVPLDKVSTIVPLPKASSTVQLKNTSATVLPKTVSTTLPLDKASTTATLPQASPSVPLQKESTAVSLAKTSISVPIPKTSPSVPLTKMSPSVPLPMKSTLVLLPNASSSVPHQKVSTSVPIQMLSLMVQLPKASTSLPLQTMSSSVPLLKTSASVLLPKVSTPPSVPFPKGPTSVPFPKASTSVPFPKGQTSVPFPKGQMLVPFPKASTSVHFPKGPTSVPLQKATTSNAGASKDKTSSKSSDQNKSLKTSEKVKNSKDDKTGRKSSELNKNDTEFKNNLHKPPFLSKKSSAPKSSKTPTTGQKIKDKPRNLYTTTNCSTAGKTLYSCVRCSVVKTSLASMLSHSKKHEDVLYECSICPYRKHSRSRVVQHIESEHRNGGRVRAIYKNRL